MMKFFNQKLTPKCLGCGSHLTDNPESLGYTPKPISVGTLCQSCYKLKHYKNPPKNDPLVSQEFVQQLNKLQLNTHSQKLLTILVTDVYNLGGILELKDKLITANILVCINKIDLITYFQKQLLVSFWTQQMKQLQKNFVIILVSARSKTGLNPLWTQLKNFNQIYLIGNSGVGKSQIVNALCRKMKIPAHTLVGSFLNTTKNIIATKIEHQKILDTPGFIREHGLFQYLDSPTIKNLQESVWHKKIFQKVNGKTFFWQNYLVIQIISLTEDMNQSSINFDGPNCLNIVHMKSNNFNFEKLNRFLDCENSSNDPIQWVEYHYVIDDKTHWVIDDLGWIGVNAQTSTKIIIYLPRKVHIQKFKNWRKN